MVWFTVGDCFILKFHENMPNPKRWSRSQIQVFRLVLIYFLLCFTHLLWEGSNKVNEKKNRWQFGCQICGGLWERSNNKTKINIFKETIDVCVCGCASTTLIPWAIKCVRHRKMHYSLHPVDSSIHISHLSVKFFEVRLFSYTLTHTFALLDCIFDLENVLWLFNLVDIDFVHYIFTKNEKKTIYCM